MSSLKQTLTAFFGVHVIQIRKFRDPLNPGNLIEVDGKKYLVLKQFRRGFFTIYYVTSFNPSRMKISTAVRIIVIRKLYKLGLYTSSPDLNK